MNTELRNRLEEAATQQAIQTLAYFAQHNQTPTHFDWADKVKEEYIAGAEYGYKEAIEQTKDWLKNSNHFYQGGSEKYPEVVSMYDTIEEMVADFETCLMRMLKKSI